MKSSPVARTESLIVKEVDGETLVYDLKTDKAHCLNETAARVWKNCDGHKSVSEISGVLSVESGTDVREELVWLALDQLEKFKLLEEAPAKPGFLASMTRRQMVARLGIAAVALPVIISIVSPTAASAASGGATGTCCISPNDCLSQQCNQDPKNGPFCDGVGAPPGAPSTKSCA
jgi:hypothetical protein